MDSNGVCCPGRASSHLKSWGGHEELYREAVLCQEHSVPISAVTRSGPALGTVQGSPRPASSK